MPDIKRATEMEYFSIDSAPKDGTRILAWPCEVGQERAGVGAGSHYRPVYGWACVSWVSAYGKWWIDPNEATEDDPEDQNPRWWIPLPATPMGESA